MLVNEGVVNESGFIEFVIVFILVREIGCMVFRFFLNLSFWGFIFWDVCRKRGDFNLEGILLLFFFMVLFLFIF